MGYIDPPPFGSNNIKEPFLFEQRLLYKQKSFSNLFDPTPLDIIYEKPLYGKVDIYGTPIYPSEIDMTQIPGDGLMLTLNFVAAAFNDFKGFVDRALKSDQRVFGDIFSSFVPKSATENVHQVYNDHFVKNVFEVFVNEYIKVPKINKRIRNFNNLVTEFLHFTEMMSNQFPVTKTGFIVSPFCTNAISGLFIEMDMLPYDNDATKYRKYLSRPSFNRYLKTADAFGFYVDKNIPWRIAVNMDSPVTIDYMNAFGVSLNDNSVFSNFFYKSEYFSYESIKARLWNIYVTLITNPESQTYGTEYKVKNHSAALWADVASNSYETCITEGLREPVSLDFENEFKEKYNDEYFLPLYFKLRLKESKIEFKQQQFTSAMKKISNLHRAYGIQIAVSYMGELLKKTNIYEMPPIDKMPPYKIKYFGESTSSGLYSYLVPDIINNK